MRKFPLISITFLGLALSFGLAACDGDDGGAEGAETGDGDPGDGDGDSGDGDGDSGDGDGDGDGGCFEPPEECLRFVECISAVAPGQAESAEEQYGADGSCWCGTQDEAVACYQTCEEQLAAALTNFPTEPACHETYCTIDELDESQPYGPVADGACPDWNGNPQVPLVEPFNVAGSVCSPPCSGIANTCPDHPQTSAAGTCYLVVNDQEHCVNRCWVDSEVIGGTQCQCGARCQPQGAADAEGNLRGICTFE